MERTTRHRLPALTALAVASGSVYLVWRVGWTLSAHWWLSVPLLVAEALLFLRFVLWCSTVGVADGRPRPADRTGTPPADEAGTRPWVDEVEGLVRDDDVTVEVLVPAAGADADDLARTLLVLRRDRRAVVRVLDTEHRDDLASEAQRSGAAYQVLTPAACGGDAPVEELRAGLVEAARADVATAAMAWIDAGDVALPGFLDLAAGLGDPSVAVVQSAVELMNPETLRRVVPRGDDTALDQEVVAPSLDVDGAAPWHGSGSVARTRSLAAVGGLVHHGRPDTSAAALALSAVGGRVRLAEPAVVRTSAPDTLADYLARAATRARRSWVLAPVALRLLAPRSGRSRPEGSSRLRRRRGLAQLHAATAPLDAVARLVVLAVLVAVLVTARMPVDASLGVVALAFLAQLTVRTLATAGLAGSALSVGDTTRQGLRLMEVRLRAAVGAQRTQGRWTRLGLLTAALVVLDVALLARGATFLLPDLLPRFDADARLVAMAAAVWTVVPMVDVLGVLVGAGQRRSHHRVETRLVAEVGDRACRTVDLTPRGMGLVTTARLATGDHVEVALWIPRLDGGSTAVALPATVRHVADADDSNLRRAGVSFDRMEPAARDALVEFCALSADQRDDERDDTFAPGELAVPGRRAARTTLGALSVVGVVLASTVVMAGPAAAKEVPGGPVGGGSITGTVLTPAGDPASFVCVNAWDGSAGAWGSTDESGTYVLDGVPAGSTRVTAGGCGEPGVVATYHPSTPWWSEAAPVEVTDGGTATADVSLVAGATLSGRAVDGAGTPLGEICANAVRPDGSDWQWFASSAPDGSFSGTVPADTEMLVNLSDCRGEPRVVTTWVGGADRASASTLSFPVGDAGDLGEVALNAGGRLSGTVTDDAGTPTQGICVSALDVTDGGWNHVEGTATGADGTFQMVVPGGEYSVWASDCRDDPMLIAEFHPDAPPSDDPPVTAVAEGGAVELDISLATGGRIAGTVTDASGAGIAGVCIDILSADALVSGDWRSNGWATSGPDGSWISGPVPPGEHVVAYASCDDGPWLRELRSDHLPSVGGDLSSVSPVTVVAGEVTAGIDDDLTRGVRIAGTVAAQDGTPLPDVCIGGLGDEGTRSGGDGTFSALVPPGAYELVASDCLPGRGATQTVAAVVAPEGAESVDAPIRMALAGPGTITGSVRNAAGTPLQPVCAVAYVPDDLVGMGMAGEDGTFTIAGLGPGSYLVGVFGCEEDPTVPMVDPDSGTGHGPMWFPGVPIDFPEDGPPATDGATPLQVTVGGTATADFCVGDCADDGAVPPVSAPPTTAPPVTAPPTRPSAPVAVPGSSPFTPTPVRLPAPTAVPEVEAVAATPQRPAPPADLVARLAAAREGAATTAPPADATADGTTGSGDTAPTATAGPTTPDPEAGAVRDLGEEVAAGAPPADEEAGTLDVLAGVGLMLAAAAALLVLRRRHLAGAA